MQTQPIQQPEIEPFEFQNRTVYRDLLRLTSTIRETQQATSSNLGKTFLRDFFESLFFISKDIAYLSVNEDPMLKMNILASCITKTFDCMTALDICFEAKWISSLQYFEIKQILEKSYWTFREDQKTIMRTMNIDLSKIDFEINKQYQ